MPATATAACEYSVRYVRVLDTYDLTFTAVDAAALRSTLRLQGSRSRPSAHPLRRGTASVRRGEVVVFDDRATFDVTGGDEDLCGVARVRVDDHAEDEHSRGRETPDRRSPRTNGSNANSSFLALLFDARACGMTVMVNTQHLTHYLPSAMASSGRQQHSQTDRIPEI